jgi:AcrR family transcriptional regulator
MQTSRRLSVTSEARRRQIIEAAIAVLAEGVGGTSFARIADRAGLSSPGLISYHFANRREMVEAVLKHVDDLRTGVISAALPDGDGPAGRLAAMLRADVGYLAARPELFAAVVEGFHSLRNEDGRLAHLGQRSRAFGLLLDLLREGQESRDFTATFDAESLALIIDGARTQFLAQLHRRPDLDVETFSRTLVGLALMAVGQEVP